MVSIAALSLLLVAGISAAEVYSGTPAKIEDIPSIVQIENGPIWVQTCVGTLLTSRHVLSAAHCTYGPLFTPRLRRVRAGAGERGRGGEVMRVDRVINHPSFKLSNGFDADISIVILSGSFTFSSTIQQATIVNTGVSFPANVPVTIAGWGRTAQDAFWADRELHTVSVHSVSEYYCRNKYASLPVPITITENMICTGIAGADGHSLGLRDGGAPVFYDGILVGIVSFGSPYGDSYPLVATAVSSFTQWILDTVG